MSSLWGRDYFGTVDQIPGRCHIQTAFDHVLRVPVFPHFSVLVLPPRSRAGEPEVFGVPFCWRSLAYAYARTLLVLVAVSAAGAAAHQLLNPSAYQGKWWKRVHRPEIAVGLSALAAAGFGLSYSMSRASGPRKAGLIRAVEKLRAPTCVYASLGHVPAQEGPAVPVRETSTPALAPPATPRVPIALPPVLFD